MDELLKCFADPVRFRILHLLANRGPEICVCDFVAVLNLPQGTISRHLMRLRHLGIVSDRRRGTWIHYSLAKPANAFHRGLLKCMRTCCNEEQRLQDDLVRYDSFIKKGTLSCCEKITQKSCCPAPAARKVNSSSRHSSKTKDIVK